TEHVDLNHAIDAPRAIQLDEPECLCEDFRRTAQLLLERLRKDSLLEHAHRVALDRDRGHVYVICSLSVDADLDPVRGPRATGPHQHRHRPYRPHVSNRGDAENTEETRKRIVSKYTMA